MNHNANSLWAALALARRDLLEFLRDRRTVAVTLLLPMITYPLVALSSSLGVRTGLKTTEERQSATPLSLVLSGPEAPRLATRLGMVLLAAEDNEPSEWPSEVFAEIEPPRQAKELLESGKVDLWINVPNGFTKELAEFNTVNLTAHVSDKYPASEKTRSQFESLIESFATQVREERMGVAGVPLSLFDPIKLMFEGKDPETVVADRRIMAPVAGAILVLLSVLTMTGSFYPAIDAIAGEKERGTIETLLIVPCRTQDIVFGKYLAIFGVTLATLAANVISIFSYNSCLSEIFSRWFCRLLSAKYWTRISDNPSFIHWSFISSISDESRCNNCFKKHERGAKHTDSCHPTYQCTCRSVPHTWDQPESTCTNGALHGSDCCFTERPNTSTDETGSYF